MDKFWMACSRRMLARQEGPGLRLDREVVYVEAMGSRECLGLATGPAERLRWNPPPVPGSSTMPSHSLLSEAGCQVCGHRFVVDERPVVLRLGRVRETGLPEAGPSGRRGRDDTAGLHYEQDDTAGSHREHRLNCRLQRG
jgi:hypothetical protein